MKNKFAVLILILACCALNAAAMQAAAGTGQPAPQSPDALSGNPISQLATAATAAWILQRIKAAGWFKWITPESTSKVQRAFSALLAVAATAGIHFAFDRSAADAGTYVITITGLTVQNGLHFGWDAFQQFILQHFAYHNGIKPAA